VIGCWKVEGKLCIFLNQSVTVSQTNSRIIAAVDWQCSCRIAYCTNNNLSAVHLAQTDSISTCLAQILHRVVLYYTSKVPTTPRSSAQLRNWCFSRHPVANAYQFIINFRIFAKNVKLQMCTLQTCDNKYERYYWTRKAPTCLLTLLCHYGKPRLFINIHQYAPPIGCSVTHRGAISMAAVDLCVLVKFRCQVLNR